MAAIAALHMKRRNKIFWINILVHEKSTQGGYPTNLIAHFQNQKILECNDHIENRKYGTRDLHKHKKYCSITYATDILILLIAPLPFYEKYVFANTIVNAQDNEWYIYYYYLSDILLALMFLRIRFIIKCFTNWTVYTNAFAKYVCSTYGFNSGQLFTIKCYFEIYPAHTFFAIFTTSVFVMAYTMRIVELPYARLLAVNLDYDIANFMNAIYLVLMTITTVGYGDLVPQTSAGKGIAVVASLWGSLLVSLLVVTQLSIFELDGN